MLGLAKDIAELVLSVWNYFRDKAQQTIGAQRQENVDLKASAKTEDAELQAAVDRPSASDVDDELQHGSY